jgi:hypothetical protein
MSPKDIALARRIIACGFPVPTFTPGVEGGCAEWETAPATSTWEAELAIGGKCRPFGSTSSAGLLFRCVATDTGPELLPVLEDFALVGWLITELERIVGPVDINVPLRADDPEWQVTSGSAGRGDTCRYYRAPTRVEALTAALKAAKAAQ